MHRKLKYYLMLGAPIMVGGVLLGGEAASAATLSPSLSIEAISPAVSDTTLEFKGASERASAEYNIPVKISYQDIKDLTITFYATNDISTPVEENKGIGGYTDANGTTSNTNIIPGDIEGDTEVISGVNYSGTISLYSYDSNSNNIDKTKKLHSIPLGESKTISQMPDMWGYRYKLANTSTDVSTEAYTAMPTSTSPLQLDTLSIANNTLPIDNTTGRGEKYLNFGFAASVTKAQTSGTYAGRAIVSAVASPNYITLYDMQDRHMTMQQMSSDICDNTPTPAPTATEPATSLQDLKNSIITAGEYRGLAGKIPQVGLEDHRQVGTKDGQPVYYSYLVAKLADERCWMIQNLALTGGTTISSADSDISSGSYTLPSSSNTGYTPYSVAERMYNGSHLDNTYDTQGYNHITDACESSDPALGCNGANSGAYYTWTAATAGTGASAVAASNETITAPASICPKGWQLPGTDARGNVFARLYGSYDPGIFFYHVWHQGYPGGYYDMGFVGDSYNKLQMSGYHSYFFSAHASKSRGNDNSIEAFRLFVDHQGNMAAINYTDVAVGSSVRCVAR